VFESFLLPCLSLGWVKGLIDLLSKCRSRSSIRGTLETVGWAIRVESAAGAWDCGRSAVGNLRSGIVLVLAGDGRSAWDAGAGLGAADAEHRALPALALLRELLVLRGLGGDAGRQVDVGENAVLLGHGRVELFVLDRLLDLGLLLLGLGEASVGGSPVLLVNVLDVVWIRVGKGVLLGLLSLLMDLVDDAVQFAGLLFDSSFEHLLERWFHSSEQKRLRDGEEQLVLGLLQLDVEMLDTNLDI